MDGIRRSRRRCDRRPARPGCRAGGRGSGRRRTYSREELPQLRNEAERCLLLRMRAKGACPSLGARILPGFRPGAVQFRRQDLADAADARLATGRDDPPLHCRRARAVHLARCALSIHRLRDVRGAQLTGALRSDRRENLPAAAEDGDRRRQERARQARDQAQTRCRGKARASLTSTPDRENRKPASPKPKRCPVAQRSHRLTAATKGAELDPPFIENVRENPELVSMKTRMLRQNTAGC